MAAIAIVDWQVKPNVSLGFLYLFPMLLMAPYLDRAEIVTLATLATILREAFGPFPWDASAGPRIILVLLAFLGAGLWVSELFRSRKQADEHLSQMQQEVKLRQEMEEQMRVLIETSPAAILTADEQGKILLSNAAAHRLLGFEDGPLAGKSIATFLPVIDHTLYSGGESDRFRTMLESKGYRRNGEVFLARIWFSTYRTGSGPKLAAIVSDASEDLRDRSEAGLHSALSTSRILVGAVSHEVRNFSAAAAVVHANLARFPGLRESDDYKALGTLVEGLTKIASARAPLAPECAPAGVDLHAVLEELRIVVEPSFLESETDIQWDVAPQLPPVRGDHHRLLQVFLNLAQNSHRAMQGQERRRLSISAAIEGDWTVVRFRDTGPGARLSDRLFEPFQPGADGSGLGLYVSRAMIRAFDGDLRYEPQPAGSCFVVHLAPFGGELSGA
ncbi:MAG: PAS domain-containing protein [Acidobacteria bacterium]|nr:PAS domain-containing protein [Acidobacteriota bacterium]